MRYLLFTLLACLSFASNAQQQIWTFSLNECRMFADDGTQRYSFLVHDLRWVDRDGPNLLISDDRRTLTVSDGMIANYTGDQMDSLKLDMATWVDSCRVGGVVPPPPTPAASLFANHRSIDLSTNQYIDLGAPADLSFGNGTTDVAVSMAAWVYMDDATSFPIISKDEGGAGVLREYGFYVDGGDDLQYGFVDQSVPAFISTESNVALTAYEGQWVHLAGVYDGNSLASGISIFVNGVEVASTDLTSGVYTAMEVTAEEARVGGLASGPIYADGKIDQAVIFRNVALTVSEIKELMGMRDITQHSQYDSTVLYFEFDNDVTGASGITDLSADGTNDGTMVNGIQADINECIPFPYSYQLVNSTSPAVDSLTPFQSDSNVVFGAFSLDYNGTNQYTTVPDNAALSFTNDTMYMGAWINFSDVTSAPIMAKVDEYVFWINATNDLEVRYYDASAAAYIGRSWSVNMVENQTHFVEAIKVGTTIDLRWNGIVVDDVDRSSGVYVGMENTANPFLMGGNWLGNYSTGLIGDAILSGAVVSDAEGLAMYNNHEPLDQTNTAFITDIVGYWRGQNSTNTASGVLDQSTSGTNDGTMTNMADSDIQYEYAREIFESDSAGSFDFNGTNQYITIASSDSLSMVTLDGASDTSFIISTWVKADNWTSFVLFTFDQTSNRTIQALSNSNADLLLAIFDSGGDYIGRRYGTANGYMTQYTGDWVHLAFVYFGNEIQSDCYLYLNGQRVDDANYSSGVYNGLVDADNAINIATNTGVSIFGNGQLSQFTIIKGLPIGSVDETACYIQQLYNDGSPIDITEATFYQPNFIQYKLNQSDSPTATDGVKNWLSTGPNGSGVNSPTLSTTFYPTN